MQLTSCGLAGEWLAVSCLSVCMEWGVCGECNQGSDARFIHLRHVFCASGFW